jgi:hypothetical protein
MDRITFLAIPKNSVLLAFGDCFQDANNIWRINCYFKSPNKVVSTVAPVVESLPALALRRIYSAGKIKVSNDESAYFRLPPFSTWNKIRMAEVPPEIHKTHYKEECKHQWVYKVIVDAKVIWIPVLELARILFLKTAENTRYAFYETNLLAMASLNFEEDKATIRLSKRYPRRLLDTKLHQEYLAWLLLNAEVTDSFCSMFELKNSQSFIASGQRRWTFDFNPMDLNGITINSYGKSLEANFFVNEIVSIGRVPTNKKYEKVIIEHPEDIEYKKQESTDKPGEKPLAGKSDFKVNPTVDDSKPPSASSKQRVLDIPRGRLYFLSLMEPERHFAEVEVDEKGKGKRGSKNADKAEVNSGITEGDSKSKNRKMDFQALNEAGAVPIDFFKHIRTVLHHIKETKKLTINERTGVLTDEKCRSFMWMGSGKRRYFCGEIILMPDNVVTLLELDLSDKHGLTTLLLRLPPEDVDSIEMILEALVELAGRWDKELIDELADMATYVNHPKNLLEEGDNIDYDNWAARIMKDLN